MTNSLSTLVRERRTQAGLTQQELADRAGVSPRTVLRLEDAQTEPTNETISKVFSALASTNQ
jgi:transcriptional regulator with XRE-family HTH domain